MARSYVFLLRVVRVYDRPQPQPSMIHRRVATDLLQKLHLDLQHESLRYLAPAGFRTMQSQLEHGTDTGLRNPLVAVIRHISPERNPSQGVHFVEESGDVRFSTKSHAFPSIAAPLCPPGDTKDEGLGDQGTCG